jgi:ADP-ribose pyrophosphatase|tara:strand:- start:668 stop:1186 length:519 start_codon:yes stop_codon:yes gene_type:complete
MKIKKTKKYKGKNINIALYETKLNGTRISQEIVEQGNVVAVLAIDDDEAILVNEFRYPVGYVLEIPAGTVDKGETPLKCAKRELLEETGYKAKKIEHLIRFFPKLGYNTQIIDCYVATKLTKISDPNLDEDELITVKKIKFRKLLNMINNGKIYGSYTICAVMIYAARKKLI